MKNVLKTEMIQPLMNVARRYSTAPEYATFAAAFVVLLAAHQGWKFPLPDLEVIVKGAPKLPDYVRKFIEETIGGHWSEYQLAVGSFDEEELADFFAAEAMCLLMEAREDSSVHPVIDTLCTGLLDITRGEEVTDLNCGIGKFVQKSWFALWNVTGSDKGLSVTGYSPNATYAALSWIACNVAEVNAQIIHENMFSPTNARYDKVLVIPPFGFEARQLNILEVSESIAVKFEKFPEVRLASADWLFAARAAALLKKGGRAIAAMPMNALNGGQSKVYREYLVRNQMIEAVISVPAKHFMNGTGIGFALVVLHEGSEEIKFVNGEEYLGNAECGIRNAECGIRNAELGMRNAELGMRNAEFGREGGRVLDVKRLLEDYKNLNDYEAVKTVRIDEVYGKDCNLTPDFYLGENLVYNNSQPFGKMVKEIRRGAKLSVSAWKAVEGSSMSGVKRVAFRHLGDGLVDEELPGLTEVPAGAEDAVLEEGDLLISRMGSPFKVAVVEHRNEKLIADENVWIVRMGGNRTLAYFLRAYLESERGAKWLLRLSAGTTLRTISAKNIAKIPVPDADEETRAAIARELEKTTMLVRENRKRLDESRVAMRNTFEKMRNAECGMRNVE